MVTRRQSDRLIRSTLVSDGSSDRTLIPIIEWVLDEATETTVALEWANLSQERRRTSTLRERLTFALKRYPCELLFVHRDAEGQQPDWRYEEVASAVSGGQNHVAVVPIRMQEAWLLHDEPSIRRAAGGPHSTEPMGLPTVTALEDIPDPKRILHDALRLASGKTGRRLKKFNPHVNVHRLATLIEDWSPLRALSAFRRLEEDTRRALRAMGVAAH